MIELKIVNCLKLIKAILLAKITDFIKKIKASLMKKTTFTHLNGTKKSN